MILINTGWIKVYRSLLHHWIYKDPEALKLWLTLILKASHKKHRQKLGLDLVELEPGQLIFGINSFTELTGINRNKLYRLIQLFSEDDMITYDTEASAQYSIITISNWHFWQAERVKLPSSQASGGQDEMPSKHLADTCETPAEHVRNPKEIEMKTNNNKRIKNEELKTYMSEINKIWEHYCQLFTDIYKPRSFTDTRKKKILARLKTFTSDEIATALTRIRNNDYLCGANPSNSFYAAPEYCFRNDEVIEKNLARPLKKPVNKASIISERYQQALEEEERQARGELS